MPLAGPVLGGLITAQFAAVNFKGTQNITLAMAIGNGVVINFLATNIYQGQAVGVGTGVGIGTGTIQGIVGPVVGTLINGFMLKSNIKGTQAINMANAIGNAFATHIATGIVTSTAAPVANGTGFGLIQGVTGIGVAASIYAFMQASGLTGTQAANLSFAIGDGIAAAIKIGIVQTTIVGAGYPPVPTAGVDIGKML